MRPSQRPRVQIIPDPLDRVLDWVSLAGLALLAVLLATSWSHLPARVPTHFGLSGRPDAWGSRNSLLFLALLPLVMHVALTILARFPWTYNYPVTVTEQNYAWLYMLGRRMMLWMRTELVWFLTLLTWQTIEAARKQSGTLSPVVLFGGMGMILFTTFYFIVQMSRKPPQ